MLLITEQLNDTRTIIEEGKDGKKNLYIEGIFAQAEQKNHNGRIYPKSILSREVKQYNEQYIQTKRALGELNHPQRANVDPERASHLIVSLVEDGNNFIGKARILDTPMGNIVRGLVEGGVNMGVSTRGLGTVSERNGINYVNEDFEFKTVDVVSDPSAPDAFVNGIMEMKDFVWQQNEERAERIMKKVMRMPAKRVAEEQAKMFESFLKGL